MKKLLEIFLSILTAMGGFVEIGELVFSVNAGAKFGYQLLWVVVVGTAGIIVYGEMAGRIAAVRRKPVFDVIREHVGYRGGLGTLLPAAAVSLLTCAAEIGGCGIILRLLFGGSYRMLIVVAFVLLLLSVWFLSFQWIERVYGLLGLFMVVFLVAAVMLKPDWSGMAAGLVPRAPEAVSSRGDYLNYAYFAVALMSSIMLPYETYFYASGAIEDGWEPTDITLNRIIVVIGFALGSLLAVALIVVGAEVLRPLGIEPQLPGTAALGPAQVMGHWGVRVALLGMLFAFAGAAVENALTVAYIFGQFCGWPWGKFRAPRDASRFTLTWIVVFVVAVLIVLTGVDPVGVVEYSIVFSVVILPLTYLPILLTARDERTMGRHANGRVMDFFGWTYLILISLAAVAAIPLLVLSHGGKR